MTDIRSAISAKSSFGIQPRKVGNTEPPSPFARIPDDVFGLDRTAEREDEGFSLGQRCVPIDGDDVVVEMRTDDFTSLRTPAAAKVADIKSSEEPNTAEFAARAKSTLDKRQASASSKKYIVRETSGGKSSGEYANRYLWSTAAHKASQLSTLEETVERRAKVLVSSYTMQQGHDELLVRSPAVNQSLIS